MPVPPDDEASRPRKPSEAPRPCLDCSIDNGLPTVRGKGRGHYVAGLGGRPTLIVERRRGERIRINATTELVILEAEDGEVKIAIEGVLEEQAGS